MKKRPNNKLTGSAVPAILLTSCLLVSQVFAEDYFHLGGSDGSRIPNANQYSNIDGDFLEATVAPGSADNLFFYNSLVIGPFDQRLEMGATSKLFNSVTFGSNVGTTQIDRGATASTNAVILGLNAGGLTVNAGAGPVTFGRLVDSGNSQRVIVGVYQDLTVANNSSSDLTFNREFDGRGTAQRTVTVAGSGDGNTIFKQIRSYDAARNLAIVINKTSGTGVIRFEGVNNYTGDTIVTAGTLVLADNAQLRFVLGATSGVNNSISGAGTVTLDGDFFIDTTAADALPSGSWTLENVTSLTGAYGPTFTVVGFTDAGGDKWTKDTVPGRLYTFDEATGTLTSETTASAYDTWKAANAPGSNPDDDSDGDGVTNAVEFVLGGTSTTNDLDKLPEFAADGTNMTFSFFRKQSSIDAKTALLIETSTDLATWDIAPSAYTVPDGETVGPPVTVVKGVPAEFDTVTLTVPQDSAKKFARLKVLITP